MTLAVVSAGAGGALILHPRTHAYAMINSQHKHRHAMKQPHNTHGHAREAKSVRYGMSPCQTIPEGWI